MEHYQRGFVPYGCAAFLIGLVGGFSTVLGPAFVGDLGIPYSNTTWTALAQAMSTAACAPILGRLGDALGRRPTLLCGIAVFTLGNALSALADSLVFMLAARFVVGLGTATMTPVILSYIVAEYPQEALAKGFSLYMLISSASVVAGPALGGLMTAHWGWRVMLWVCTAVCAAVFVLCLLTGRREPLRRQPLRDFDSAGAALVLLFFSLLLCIPSFGQNFGWRSPAFLSVLTAAVVSLAGLAAAERRAALPLLPVGFMKRRAFILSVSALFLTQGLMQANMTNSIVFWEHIRPGSAAVSGSAVSVLYLGMSLGAVLLGPLADRVEPKTVLTGSLLLTGGGCALMGLFSGDTPLWLLMASLGLLGLGLGGNGTIFLKVVLSGLPPREAGTASGAYGLFRDLAAPFGVAVFVPLFTNRTAVLAAAGAAEADAAVGAVHMLALPEVLCVAAGIAVVRFLPKIQTKGEFV